MKGITFDQYERYLAAIEIINHLENHKKINHDSPMLDIGGFHMDLNRNPMTPFSKLMQGWNILTADVQPCKLPGYVKLEIGKPLPFEDEAFDIVVCMDVLEHLRDDQRQSFLEEIFRITREFLILGAPFQNSERDAADTYLDGFSRAALDAVPPSLNEHRSNGLPSNIQFESLINKNGFSWMVFENGDLGKWYIWMALKHLLMQCCEPDLVMELELGFFRFTKPVCSRRHSYRDIYLITKRDPHIIQNLKKHITFITDQIRTTVEGDIDFLKESARCLERIASQRKILGEHHNKACHDIDKLNKNMKNWERIVHQLHHHFEESHKNMLMENKELHETTHNKDMEISELRMSNQNLFKDLNTMQKQFHAHRDALREILYSRSYRILRNLLTPIDMLKLIRKKMSHKTEYRFEQQEISSPNLNSGNLTETIKNITPESKSARTPLISILTPVFDTDPVILREMLESVRTQDYTFWEHCLVDDGSKSEGTKSILREYNEKYPGKYVVRFLEKNEGIAPATNAAAEIATGEYIAFLDHDDLLSPDALSSCTEMINQFPETDFIYSDEDKLDNKGEYIDPFFKPDFSPELLLSINYICHFTLMKKSLFHEIGKFRKGFEGSQDYDLFLRATEKAVCIKHIPKILYHWRMIEGSAALEASAKGGFFRESSMKALQDALKRRDMEGSIEFGLAPGSYRTRLKVDSSKKVTIIIPIKDRVDLLIRCIESIYLRTIHSNYEILVVSNNSEQSETHFYLEKEAEQSDRFKYLIHNTRFNFSELNNIGVRNSDGEYIVFLNNDTEIIESGWLTAMLEYAQIDEIGAVGSKLLYPDNTIQHVGIVMGMGGIAGHVFKTFSDDNHYFGQPNMIRNYSAVTGACLMMRRNVFDRVEGFDENLGVAFNDVDLCLRIRKAGYRIVFTPFARLYHYESKSRGSDDTVDTRPRFHSDIAYLLSKWRDKIYCDPYHNPNLSLLNPNIQIKEPNEKEKLDTFYGAFLNLFREL
ncbi:glycosyltransferase [bacterium]|nr:glycosyltransferase [bacterium]